jgi:hypothetical protein
MNTKQAIQALKSLVEGIDPTTGKEFEHNPVLQNANVIRALLAGVGALQEKEARETRRAMLPANVGNPWTAEQEQQLIDAFNAGDPLAEVGERMGRSLRGIEARLVKLGLISPEQRTTTDTFTSGK